MIKEGTYEATLVKHGISETKAGKAQAYADFKLNTPGSEQITWYGGFTEKSTPWTVKVLLTLGLQGNNPAGALLIGKNVSLVIVHETGEDMKIRAKIKFVNELGGVRNVIPQEMAIAKLSDLSGAVMQARVDMNKPDEEKLPF